MWPVVLGGAALVGLLLKSKPDTDEPQPERKPQPQIKKKPQHEPLTQELPEPTSPIRDVTWEQWLKFRGKMEDPKHASKDSPPGLLGLYRFSMPRLSDVGLVGNVHKDGKLWVGAFIPPITRELFTRSPRMQRRLFEVSCGDFVTRIREEHARDIGREIDGTRVTLSGLVAVAHRAGFVGLKSWLRKPEDRKRFPHTTAAFKAANGVF